MLKLLIGGSPCTHWSIAQTKNREIEANGIGWDLFLNYRIARDKYKPDYFLYENNKSMSPVIRAQITKELGVEPVLINSSLVSAQNRQRLYWIGKRDSVGGGTYSQVNIKQLIDHKILLSDILENSVSQQKKGCILKESVNAKLLTEKEMAYMVRETKDGRNHFDFNYFHDGTKDKSACVTANTHKGVPYNVLAEPVRISTIKVGEINSGGQGNRIYPVNTTVDGKAQCLRATYYKDGIRNMVGNNIDRKTCVAVPAVETEDGNHLPAYEVRNGFITIKGKQYPIKLEDGFYIIRKLTVTECKRLQTIPDEYVFPVSDSQAYKMLGNGWTIDVITHIMSHFDGLMSEPVEVLSMYDGMSCGHIALDKLGADVKTYYATEIDKYAIQTTQTNFPNTVQLGDAFQVRDECWAIPR